LQTLTPYHAKYFAYELTRRCPPDSDDRLMCTAFRGRPEAYPNLTIKKIPRTVLARCEWGRDDYSLEVANLGPAPAAPGQQGLDFAD